MGLCVFYAAKEDHRLIPHFRYDYFISRYTDIPASLFSQFLVTDAMLPVLMNRRGLLENLLYIS